MVWLIGHRQTKGAATAMPDRRARHISTLPTAPVSRLSASDRCRSSALIRRLERHIGILATCGSPQLSSSGKDGSAPALALRGPGSAARLTRNSARGADAHEQTCLSVQIRLATVPQRAQACHAQAALEALLQVGAHGVVESDLRAFARPVARAAMKRAAASRAA